MEGKADTLGMVRRVVFSALDGDVAVDRGRRIHRGLGVPARGAWL